MLFKEKKNVYSRYAKNSFKTSKCLHFVVSIYSVDLQLVADNMVNYF